MLGDAMINMTAGMVLGMAVCPIMMKVIKSVRQSIRVNRIFRNSRNIVMNLYPVKDIVNLEGLN
jgi:hypothetical protein